MALRQAERFQQLDPDNYRSLLLKGKILFAQSDTLQALQVLNSAFDMYRHDDELNLILLDLLLHQADSAAYQRVYNRIVNDHYGWLMKLGALKYSHGLIRESNEDFTKILTRDDQNLQAVLHLSRNYFELAEYDSSIVFSTKALQLDSLAQSARLTLARSLDKKYEYNRAIGQYEILVAADSTYDNAVEELNTLYRKVAYLERLKEKQSVPQFDLAPRRRNN